MIKSKIMSYITQDFQSKSDLIVGGEEWQKVVLKMQSKFAEAGAVRQTVSQVFNKDGIDEIATKLHNQNIKIISTGGTKSFIENLGIPVTSVESITDYPSILGGRVKTLHPKVFGGILRRADNKSDQMDLDKL